MREYERTISLVHMRPVPLDISVVANPTACSVNVYVFTDALFKRIHLNTAVFIHIH